jgi:hypothetical protein
MRGFLIQYNALHNLEDFFTMFSLYSHICIRIVVTFLLLLQVFRYFFIHINFVKLSIHSGGREDFTLTALVGKLESIN